VSDASLPAVGACDVPPSSPTPAPAAAAESPDARRGAERRAAAAPTGCSVGRSGHRRSGRRVTRRRPCLLLMPLTAHGIISLELIEVLSVARKHITLGPVGTVAHSGQQSPAATARMACRAS